MTGLVSTNIDKRDFYIGREVVEGEMQRGEFSLPAGYTLVPDLLMFKVVRDNKEYVPAADPDFIIRFPSNDSHYSRTIKNFVGNMLATRALYEMQFDKTDRAKLYIDKIKNDIPGFTLPAGLSQVFN
jgi:hypothetical protein